MGRLKDLNRWVSMGPLRWPHEKKKVKQNLTRNLEIRPYLVARKGTLMGPLEGELRIQKIFIGQI
jgi:hypothetical protein